jgi:alkylation response protein AidB-like acyl-CoA dehydrogenase
VGRTSRSIRSPGWLYTDARVARIYAGTSEVMKVIIAKSLGL